MSDRPQYVITNATVVEVCVEANLAHQKHGPTSILRPDTPNLTKLAALGEEFGEVARLLTYDGAGTRDRLREELKQVAAIAMTWMDSLNVDATGQLRDPDVRAVAELTS